MDLVKAKISACDQLKDDIIEFETPYSTKKFWQNIVENNITFIATLCPKNRKDHMYAEVEKLFP